MGGKGARIVGGFPPLSQGTFLSIMVGEMGETVMNNAGGGGGSFVWQAGDAELLVAAGGGGGAGASPPNANEPKWNGGEGLTVTSGGHSPGASNGGGISGQGGGHADSAESWRVGGTGWASAGIPGNLNAGGGRRPLDGSAGGTIVGEAGFVGRGGYGGGGAGQGNTGSTGSGGGGGYSGGAGGDRRLDASGVFQWGAGGGGGSFNSGSDLGSASGNRAGILCFICPG